MPITIQAKGSLRKIRGVLGRWYLHMLNPYWSDPCDHAGHCTGQRQPKKNSKSFWGRWYLHILNPYLSDPCSHANHQTCQRQHKKNSKGFGAVQPPHIKSLLVGSMRPCRSADKPQAGQEKFERFWWWWLQPPQIESLLVICAALPFAILWDYIKWLKCATQPLYEVLSLTLIANCVCVL